MIDLRPLILVTGTLHVEGGERNRMHNETKHGTTMKVVVRRTVTSDRRAANVIVTDYMRRLRKMAVLRTPYGSLLAPEKRPELRALMSLVNERILKYNSTERQTRVANCVIWEMLSGQRLAAVAGWVAAEIAHGSESVKKAVPNLVAGTLRAVS